MVLQLKKILSNNAPLKIISIIFGYSFWYIFGQSHTTTTWISIPLAFYGIKKPYSLKAPEKIMVELSGKRKDILALTIDNLVAHIDAHSLNPGKHAIIISNKTLLLPESIKLVHYKPSNVIAEISTICTEHAT